MFKEYDVVKLKKDMVHENLTAGVIGAVLLVYESDPPAYEVEFVDENGRTLALLTLTEADIEKVEGL